MPLPYFSDGTTLTAAQLNAMVDKLNAYEQLVDIPSPLFQQVILDGLDHAGRNGGAERLWRYLILHQSINQYLHFRYQWSNILGGPSVNVWIADNATVVPFPTNVGVNEVTIDLDPYGIDAGVAYVVKVDVDRQASTWFKLDWIYESQFA